MRTGLGLVVLQLLFPLALCAQAVDQEAAFWRWFVTHQPELMAIRTGHEPICDSLAHFLAQVDSNLTWEIGPPGSGHREFIISANGLRAGFPAVLSLARAAPPLPEWRVVRFRPPQPDFRQLTFKDVSLDARLVEFLARPAVGKLDLVISVPGMRDTPDHRFEEATYILLDGMVGEYAVETRLGAIDIIPPNERPQGHWRPLTELANVVDVTVPK
jgi:hypothetical protein